MTKSEHTVNACLRESKLRGWLLGILLVVSPGLTTAQESEPEPQAAEAVDLTRVKAVLVDLPNAKLPWEQILVGGQPTQDQLAEVAAAGFGTVINLRAPGELTEWDEQAEVVSLGMRYVSLPIAGKDDLTADTARQFAQHLKEAGDQPVLVHCASSNRVGALFALKAFFLDGETQQEALAIGERSGLRSLAPMVEGVLAGPNSP